MVMPWYLWLVFTGIVGQEQDDLAISDTEDETKMDSLRIQHNADDQNQKSSRIKVPRRGVPAKGSVADLTTQQNTGTFPVLESTVVLDGRHCGLT